MNDALLYGKAGEYFVCFDLSSKGIIAYTSDQGLGYDVVADVDGVLIKIQVKTTTKERATNRVDAMPSYIFHSKRCGKGGKKTYKNNECHIVAFVSLLDKEVAYLPINDLLQTTTFRVENFKGKYSDEIFNLKRLEIEKLKKEGKTLEQIGKIYGTSKSNIGHILKRKLNSRPARYFSDYPFDIACKRIAEAYKQPRLFDEPAPKPVQEALPL